VVLGLLLFIIIRLGYFYYRWRKSLENAVGDDIGDYIINITCDKTLAICVNLENFGLEYCE